MAIEIGQLCILVYLDKINRDKTRLNISDFSKLFSTNIELVLLEGYDDKGRYRGSVYSCGSGQVRFDNIDVVKLYELDDDLTAYLKKQGIDANRIKTILLDFISR